MSVSLSRSAVEAIKECGRSSYPEEGCGFLVGTWTPRRVEDARRMRNTAADDRDLRYEIDPKDTLALGAELRGTGRDIVGVFHSHVDRSARPSPQDLERAWPGFTYAIVAVEKGKPVDLRAWSLDDSSRAFREEDVHVE